MSKKTAALSEPSNFKRLYKQLAIARPEQAAVGDCFRRGLAHYHAHIFGAPGKRAVEQLTARMQEPYIFGFGAVEVAREPQLSLETRLKVAEHTVRLFDATAEYGIPHGLPILASFLAKANVLRPELFRLMLITASFGGAMFDDWATDEVLGLFQWLVDRVDMPKAERLWWLWQVIINCEDGALVRRLGDWLLTHHEIGLKSKKSLCQAWLNDTAPGEAPPQWEALQSLLQGDVDGFVTHAAEAGVPADDLITREEIEADYDAALDAVIDENEDDGDPPQMPLHVLRNTLVGPMGDVVYTPGVLKRLALAALPELGDDPTAVCRNYLSKHTSTQGDVFKLGVADVIRANRKRIPKPAQRKFVAQGLAGGGVAVRRTYYQLGADLFGNAFWGQAGQDEAASIRAWASKKLKSGKSVAKRRSKTVR